MPRNLIALLSLIAMTGCAAEPAASVRIEAPRNGAVTADDSVRVTLATSGIEIVAADGEPTPGRAHHHLYLDVDVTPAGEAIPKQVPGITHLGTGATEFTLKDLGPGEHRVIAVLALGDHVPLDPWAADTVFFSVESLEEAEGTGSK